MATAIAVGLVVGAMRPAVPVGMPGLWDLPDDHGVGDLVLSSAERELADCIVAELDRAWEGRHYRVDGESGEG